MVEIGDKYKSGDGYYGGEFYVTKTFSNGKVNLHQIGSTFKLFEVNIEETYFDFNSVLIEVLEEKKRWIKLPSFTLKMIGEYFELISWKLFSPKILEELEWRNIVISKDAGHLRIVSNLDLEIGVPKSFQLNSGIENLDIRVAISLQEILKEDLLII